MTSAVNYINNINTLYPQPGQDNNSQGFRDNFNNIQTALSSLDSYMDSLAATTLNVDAPFVTATQVLTTLETLQVGPFTNVNVAFANGPAGNNLVVTGQNPDGSPAVGSIAFFPNTIYLPWGTFTSDTVTANTSTTGVVPGATFTGTNYGPYSVTAVSSSGTITFNPPIQVGDSLADPLVITNPVFNDFTVINASTVSNLISQTLNNVVTLDANIISDSTASGTLVITENGGAGIGGNVNIGGSLDVNGDATIGGTLNITGNLVTAASNNIFNGLTVAGNLILADSNDDPSPTVTLTTSSFAASVNSNGWQRLPSGLIMQWGLSATTGMNNPTTTNFPIAFPNNVFMVSGTVVAVSGQAQDNVLTLYATPSTTSFEVRTGGQGGSGFFTNEPFYWYAIGN